MATALQTQRALYVKTQTSRAVLDAIASGCRLIDTAAAFPVFFLAVRFLLGGSSKRIARPHLGSGGPPVPFRYGSTRTSLWASQMVLKITAMV